MTYEQIVSALKSAYLPMHYNDNQLKNLHDRTQANGGKVDHFVSVMKGVNDRLETPLRPTELLHLVQRNLLPE